jgi:phytoene dehydrogenase-like protein
MYDTIIIGAGMSGLAAGIRLAYYDQRVCILERHTTIGGLNSFYRLGGRDFDVGLHAVTNWADPGTSRGPLARILRQLRFRWEEFALAPQCGSRISFPGVDLRFSNDIGLLREEIASRFPRDIDGFRKLESLVLDYDELEQVDYGRSTREVLASCISDPLLREMLLCPAMWYGNAREHDMDFGQFSVMFRSIFLEGLGRPLRGIRLILKNMVRRYRSLGGELKLRRGVSRIRVEDGRAVAVELDSGEVLEARRILSSAGHIETLRLCEDVSEIDPRQSGRLSFVESSSVLDCQPAELGIGETIVFYNDSGRFHWEVPKHTLCDLRTGVICSPNNYQYADDQLLEDGLIRITSIASFDRWTALDDGQYAAAKAEWYDRTVGSAVRFVPDFRPRVIATDIFTPRTIRRFTWHDNGAVYGAPDKRLDGTTHLDNLFICGNDQGFVGIVGAMMSGIAMANRHCLK